MENGKPVWGWRHYLLGTNSIAGTIQLLAGFLAFTLIGGGIFALFYAQLSDTRHGLPVLNRHSNGETVHP